MSLYLHLIAFDFLYMTEFPVEVMRFLDRHGKKFLMAIFCRLQGRIPIISEHSTNTSFQPPHRFHFSQITTSNDHSYKSTADRICATTVPTWILPQNLQVSAYKRNRFAILLLCKTIILHSQQRTIPHQSPVAVSLFHSLK